MWSRRIEDLIPEMQPIAELFIKKCAESGLDVVVTCTLRTKPVQEALYAQGRQPLDEVNALRKTVGIWSISAQDNEKPVTWTMQSKHVPEDLMSQDPNKRKSKAMDVAIRGKDKVLVWNPKVDVDQDGIADYEEIARIAESVGLVAGKRFKNPDPAHVEWKESH